MKVLREFLNDDSNVQISKYQYMISPENIRKIKQLAKIECMFYKDKKKGMFQIEYVNYENLPSKNMYSIEGLRFGGEKTSLYFMIDDSKTEIKVKEIIPKVYINLSEKEFHLVLKFDYGISVIDFLNQERQLGPKEGYRDFGFENKIKRKLKKWMEP